MRTLLPVAVLLGTALHAQTTFAPIGAKWIYTQHHIGGPDTDLFVIECVGDTTIQGYLCSRLAYTDGVNNCVPFFPALTRQGDSVLVFQPLFFHFHTLYVFNQAPGFSWQTLIDYPFGTDTVHWTVLDTAHVMIDGVTLPSQTVSATSNGPYGTEAFTSGTMHDRLGDLRYLFPWLQGPCDAEINDPLRCYEDPEISWLNPQFEQCDLSTTIGEIGKELALNVFPTVLTAGGTISVSAPPGSTLQVLDAIGRLVRSWDNVQRTEQISLMHPGLYFIRATSGHERPARILVQ